MQVLNSVDGKSDAHEYFQKMILVYGAVYDLSDFPLVSGKSCGTDELFWTTGLQEIQVKTYRLKLEYIWQGHVSISNILQNSFANQVMANFQPKTFHRITQREIFR